MRPSPARGLLTVAALAVLALSPCQARSEDALSRLGGTWGLPPDDANPYASGFGSHLSLVRDSSGQVQAKLFLYAQGWDCRQDGPVAWNGEKNRFEWPNRSSDAKEKKCWFSAEPAGERLRVAVKCSYQCTDGENTHEQVLDRFSEARLEPPPGVLITFCSSHDALRQALCRPGPIHQSVDRAMHAAERLELLGTGLEGDQGDKAGTVGWSGHDSRKPLLAALASCHARGGDASCLQAEIDTQARTLDARVAERQRLLREEQEKSRTAETRLDNETVRRAWEGSWYQVNDLESALSIKSCDPAGCELSLESETTYVFGCSGDAAPQSMNCRMGGCTLEDVRLRFTGATAAYGYLEADADPRDVAAGPFANYCRLDIARDESGIQLDLRGQGCASRCHDAPFASLRGQYSSLQTPSFACGDALSALKVDERFICTDAELAALDRDLAKAFARAGAGLSGAARRALLASQKAFLSRRGQCVGGEQVRGCLVAAYRERLAELEARGRARR